MKEVCVYSSPIGLLEITLFNKKLEKINFLDANSIKPKTTMSSAMQIVFAQLNEYFMGKRSTFSIPLHLIGTKFQLNVWKQLQSIPKGEVLNYKDIALKLGDPNASRAVGNANNKNPIPIVIPCHRVVGTNLDLVGYVGGIEKKQFLLDLEQGKLSFT